MDNNNFVEEQVDNEVVEEEKVDELDNEVFTYSIDNNNLKNDYDKGFNDKNSIVYIVIGVLILVFIIILLVIFANKNSSGSSNYEDVEKAMVKGTESYYKKNVDLLPDSDDLFISIDADVLIENSFMKPFSEMVKGGSSCTGKVTVNKSGEEYAYFPSLDCGDDYRTLTLSEKLIDSVVTVGDGLYSETDGYRFRGEYPNNYVSFDNKTWRIVKVNPDLSIKMVLMSDKLDKSVWDDRYNSSKNDYSGINDIGISRLVEYLNNAYQSNVYVSKKNSSFLVKHDWCVGKISQENKPISEMNLCSSVYDELYIGVVEADEVLRSSLSLNCVNMYDIACTNYNYFFVINTGWTMNASSDYSYNVFYSSGGYIDYKKASSSEYIRPVININSNALYKGGDGTTGNPYKFGN